MEGGTDAPAIGPCSAYRFRASCVCRRPRRDSHSVGGFSASRPPHPQALGRSTIPRRRRSVPTTSRRLERRSNVTSPTGFSGGRHRRVALENSHPGRSDRSPTVRNTDVRGEFTFLTAPPRERSRQSRRIESLPFYLSTPKVRTVFTTGWHSSTTRRSGSAGCSTRSTKYHSRTIPCSR